MCVQSKSKYTLYMQREREKIKEGGNRDCTICVLCQLYVSSACVYSQNVTLCLIIPIK